MDNWTWQRNWFWVALAVGLPLLALIVWSGFNVKPEPVLTPVQDLNSRLIDTLLALIAVALFLERALEVVVKSSRAVGRTEKDNVLLKWNKAVQDRLEQIGTLRARIADPALQSQHAEMQAQLDEANRSLEAARQERKQTMQDIQTYRTQTQKVSHIAALVAGFFIAAAGVRALDPLFDANGSSLFGYVDTLLTTGLIAGGADGLHKLISLATTYFDISKDRMSGGPPLGG